MAIINKSTNNKCWRGCGERESFALLVGMQIGIATVESGMELCQNLKMELPYDPVIFM